MNIQVIIPAHLNSIRLKRKVLINGKWLINNNLSQKEMAGVKN